MSIGIPANALKFFEIIIPIVNYDILINSKLYNDFLKNLMRTKVNDDSFDSQIPYQTKQIGYETRNPLLNQGTLTLVLFQYCFKLFMFPTLRGILGKQNCLVLMLSKSIFFKEIYLILNKAYIEFMLASLLNLYCSKGDPDNNRFNDVYVHIMLAILLIIVPAAILYVIMKSKESRENPSFHQKWGAVFDSYKKGSRLAILFELLFCIRRILFLFTVFYYRDYTFAQILYFLYFNLMMLIYNGQVSQFVSGSRNRVEQFNEFQFTVISYFTVVFTDMTP
jgi:hypothetical protein